MAYYKTQKYAAAASVENNTTQPTRCLTLVQLILFDNPRLKWDHRSHTVVAKKVNNQIEGTQNLEKVCPNFS